MTDMKTYRVIVARPRWETCDMHIEAKSSSAAIHEAIQEANRDTGIHTEYEWVAGEAENAQFLDCDATEE